MNTKIVNVNNNGGVKMTASDGSKWQIVKGNTSAAETVTVTLSSPFKNSSYAVAALPTQGSSNTSDLYVTNRTTTSFQLTQQVKKSEARVWLAFGEC